MSPRHIVERLTEATSAPSGFTVTVPVTVLGDRMQKLVKRKYDTQVLRGTVTKISDDGQTYFTRLTHPQAVHGMIVQVPHSQVDSDAAVTHMAENDVQAKLNALPLPKLHELLGTNEYPRENVLRALARRGDLSKLEEV